MAHLPLEPVDWGSLMKHEGRVCMPLPGNELHSTSAKNSGFADLAQVR
jgi:hypothetical protein